MFSIEKQNVHEKLGGKEPLDVQYLYHGTRNTPPSAIYTGEEGFDMRYSAAGFYGKGNYFAEEASYSAGFLGEQYKYQHDLGDGTSQLFYAQVIIGKPCILEGIDRSLTKPPQRPDDGDLMYDSVKGNN